MIYQEKPFIFWQILYTLTNPYNLTLVVSGFIQPKSLILPKLTIFIYTKVSKEREIKSNLNYEKLLGSGCIWFYTSKKSHFSSNMVFVAWCHDALIIYHFIIDVTASNKSSSHYCNVASGRSIMVLFVQFFLIKTTKIARIFGAFSLQQLKKEPCTQNHHNTIFQISATTFGEITSWKNCIATIFNFPSVASGASYLYLMYHIVLMGHCVPIR